MRYHKVTRSSVGTSGRAEVEDAVLIAVISAIVVGAIEWGFEAGKEFFSSRKKTEENTLKKRRQEGEAEKEKDDDD